MNGIRCITNSFYEDPIKIRYESLENILNSNRDISMKLYNVLIMNWNFKNIQYNKINNINNNINNNKGINDDGIIYNAITNLKYRIENEHSKEHKALMENIENKIKIISDPYLLKKYEKQQQQNNNWLWLRNIVLYIIIWIIIMQFKMKPNDK
jgi:hypothetical protein